MNEDIKIVLGKDTESWCEAKEGLHIRIDGKWKLNAAKGETRETLAAKPRRIVLK